MPRTTATSQHESREHHFLTASKPRMANGLDLPREVFDIIFAHLTTTVPGELRHHQAERIMGTASHLRLVCRQWADWLYESHLHRSLSFGSHSAAVELADSIRQRSELRPPPVCKYLEIDHLWPWPRDTLPLAAHADTATSETLEILLKVFSDTIVTLDIKFYDFFTLPSRTIDIIRRMPNLRNFTFGNSRWWSGHDDFPATDPGCFNALMMATPGLQSLRLDIPVCLRLEPGLPAITYLDILPAPDENQEILTSLLVALKPTLKVLSLRYRGSDYDTQPLLPAFETIRETLEGLSVQTSSFLTPIFNLHFPKLRVVSVHSWRGSITDWSTQNMFLYAPIRVLAVSSCTTKALAPADPLTDTDTFANLSKLEHDMPLIMAKCPL
ncbi:hypothetical protein PTTG_12708 [Puccinia triticina 1-1 BBBD Race 1]|uniref:F-box domain-containing protein n=2 Tax=Puccinia triticina TaxID=208348 RepID=A0A180H167_PUCT1|nr:uncharacterized protein PtA15_5A619 [Puccinia triticina]OAV98796.1 hypothetical protein PTTG_12708 [Puccinia triticina 1-1 BBBD Race 1]WAQ85045.1 hypothetical protein PtA15_5A619 [Puccinia triticina]